MLMNSSPIKAGPGPDPQSNQKRLNFMLSWIKLFNALNVIQGALFEELPVLGLDRCFVDWTTFFRVHRRSEDAKDKKWNFILPPKYASAVHEFIKRGILFK